MKQKVSSTGNKYAYKLILKHPNDEISESGAA